MKTLFGGVKLASMHGIAVALFYERCHDKGMDEVSVETVTTMTIDTLNAKAEITFRSPIGEKVKNDKRGTTQKLGHFVYNVQYAIDGSCSSSHITKK